MKPTIVTLTLAIIAVMGVGQKPPASFAGFQKMGYIAQEGVTFRQPVISPNGRWIVFVSNSPTHGLWMARSDDLRPMLLVEVEYLAEGTKYSWSPDSRQIAYVNGRTVRLIDVVTKKVVSKPTVSPFMSDPVFDAEGNLLVVGNTDLIGNKTALEGDLEAVKTITPNDRPYLVVIGKSGKVFTDEEGERQFDGPEVIVPYILGPRREAYLRIGTQDRKITPPAIGNGSPYCWDVILAPDREKVAIYCTQTTRRLSVYDNSSEKSHDLEVVAEPRSWSPDSEWVLYAEEISDGHAVEFNDLYIVHYTGKERVKIARAKGTVYGASWGKDGLIAYDEEGKIILGKITMK
jgi:hypothetical protein